MKESPLRDLARKLRNTAREHIAYSQVCDLMTHMDEYLNALAFCEEANAGRYEKTEAGVIDWKMEADRANRLLASREAWDNPPRDADGKPIRVLP